MSPLKEPQRHRGHGVSFLFGGKIPAQLCVSCTIFSVRPLFFSVSLWFFWLSLPWILT
jgi:hypothetical protein